MIGHFGREILNANVVVIRENLGSINRILQLTDVARPTVSLERRHQIGGDVPLGIDKMFYQESNVARALPQRREVNREHV